MRRHGPRAPLSGVRPTSRRPSSTALAAREPSDDMPMRPVRDGPGHSRRHSGTVEDARGVEPSSLRYGDDSAGGGGRLRTRTPGYDLLTGDVDRHQQIVNLQRIRRKRPSAPRNPAFGRVTGENDLTESPKRTAELTLGGELRAADGDVLAAPLSEGVPGPCRW